MVAISFSKQDFIDKILTGQKTTTIRKTNRLREQQMLKNGLQLYYKQRTKECRKICDAKVVWILRVDDIQLWLKNISKDGIAQGDGFRDNNEMREFFKDASGEYSVIIFKVI